ncbi:MAG: DUF1365 domain-containing protein [Pseudomonadota bacterium]
MNGDAALYVGDVVHARIRPTPHKLRYSVFCLAIDVDRIADVAARVTGFGYNRRALVSLNDADLGRGVEPIADHARRTFRDAGLDAATDRIVLLTYPRVLGYVFNPISVYYGYDREGRLVGSIYEVSNTFGERVSYVLPVAQEDGDCASHTGFRQACAKRMSVSPFTEGQGRYAFHCTQPGDDLVVGVQLRDATGPVLRTHFRGRQENLTSIRLFTQFVRVPWLTAKVMTAIHFEALQLALKRVPLVRRHRSPAFAVAAERGPARR